MLINEGECHFPKFIEFDKFSPTNNKNSTGTAI